LKSRLPLIRPICPNQSHSSTIKDTHTKARRITQGAKTIPVPITLFPYPTVLDSSLNVWKISCWGWKAGSPARGGRSCRFLEIGLRIELGRVSCPSGYERGEVAESRVDRRRVSENCPWDSNRADGALAVFCKGQFMV
jgi:hypothetical protein